MGIDGWKSNLGYSYGTNLMNCTLKVVENELFDGIE